MAFEEYFYLCVIVERDREGENMQKGFWVKVSERLKGTRSLLSKSDLQAQKSQTRQSALHKTSKRHNDYI